MQDIQALFADYAAYHRTPGNKWFHRFGIPMIMITLFGMLARVELFSLGAVRVDAALLLIAAAMIYYVVLDWRLAAAMLAVSAGMYLLGAALPMAVNVFFFILGWVLQFVGHSVYEKKQPAFLRNLVHLLVGPLWILNDVVPVVKPATTRNA